MKGIFWGSHLRANFSLRSVDQDNKEDEEALKGIG